MRLSARQRGRRHASGLRSRTLAQLLCGGLRHSIAAHAAAATATGAGWSGEADVDLFWEQGFLMIPSFASPAEVAKLRGSMESMLEEWALSIQSQSSSAGDPNTTTSSAGGAAALSSLRTGRPDHSFLLESANKASVFLEHGVVDAGGALPTGMKARQAVRKVAHGLHLPQGAIRDFVRTPKIARLATQLGWRRPAVAQTLYRLASPLSAGVDRHQDSVTLYTEPPSVLGIWLALEPADESNGCLRILKGSHRGPLRERLVRRGCSSAADEDRGPCAPELVFEKLSNATAAPKSAFTAMPVAAGDLLVMHGTTEHYSESGRDPSRGRESLQVHLVEAEARWPADNWLQYPPGQSFEELDSSWLAETFAGRAEASVAGGAAAFEPSARGSEL